MLGIGAMGHGMATTAMRAGIPPIVWNRTPAATRDLAGLGAEVAASAVDAARRTAIVVTMVTDTDAVISIARDQGMLAALRPGAIWVRMGTIGVAGIGRVAAMVAAERPDVTLLDAPVSGSKHPAEHGQLTIFASGPRRPAHASPPSLTRSVSAPSGSVGPGRVATEAGQHHPGRVRRGSGGRLGCPCSSVGACDRNGAGRPRR